MADCTKCTQRYKRYGFEHFLRFAVYNIFCHTCHLCTIECVLLRGRGTILPSDRQFPHSLLGATVQLFYAFFVVAKNVCKIPKQFNRAFFYKSPQFEVL